MSIRLREPGYGQDNYPVQAAGNPATVRNNGRLLNALMPAILAAVTLWRLWPAVDSTPFHRDEARWIGNAALLREWRHPLGPRWQDDGYRNRYGTIDESNRRRSQPPLAMYLFGLGLIVQGHGLPSTGYWIMTEDTDWNAAHGNAPSDDQLRAARRTNIAVALLTVIGIYFIGMQIVNRAGGLVAGLAYAVHPLVLSTATRAWSDPLLVLCLVWAVAATARYGKRPSLGRAIVVGVLLGLGAATKLSPLLLAVAFGCIGLAPTGWALLRHRGFRNIGMKTGLSLASIPIAAYLTFVAVYPYLWTAPITHTKRMFDFRSLSFDLQADVSPKARVDGLPDAMRRVGVQLADQYSVGGFLSRLLDRHAGTGELAWMVNLDLVFAVLGWLMLITLIVRRQYQPDSVLPVMLLLGQVGMIVMAYRLDYSRYLLPIVPAIALGIGAVTGLTWQFGVKTISGKILIRQPERTLSPSAAWARANWKR